MRISIVLGDWKSQSRSLWPQLECFTATLIANAPVIYSLWNPAWTSRLLALLPIPTQRSTHAPEVGDILVTRTTDISHLDINSPHVKKESRLSVAWNSIRSSFRSTDAGIIRTKVDILQSRKTGDMAEFHKDDAPREMETFLGDGLGKRPMSKIESMAFGDASRREGRGRWHWRHHERGTKLTGD